MFIVSSNTEQNNIHIMMPVFLLNFKINIYYVYMSYCANSQIKL